jgi:hypothetical protein
MNGPNFETRIDQYPNSCNDETREQLNEYKPNGNFANDRTKHGILPAYRRWIFLVREVLEPFSTVHFVVAAK